MRSLLAIFWILVFKNCGKATYFYQIKVFLYGITLEDQLIRHKKSGKTLRNTEVKNKLIQI